MISPICIALAASGLVLSDAPLASRTDTIRLEVGSREVDASMYAPHAARERKEDTEVTADLGGGNRYGAMTFRSTGRFTDRSTGLSASAAPIGSSRAATASTARARTGMGDLARILARMRDAERFRPTVRPVDRPRQPATRVRPTCPRL